MRLNSIPSLALPPGLLIYWLVSSLPVCAWLLTPHILESSTNNCVTVQARICLVTTGQKISASNSIKDGNIFLRAVLDLLSFRFSINIARPTGVYIGDIVAQGQLQ